MADREKLIELQEKWFSCDDRADLEKFAEFLIANGVTVQRHGKWIMETWLLHKVCCSECGGCTHGESPYCPNCGAKMDGD